MPHITRKMSLWGLAASFFAAACTTGDIEESGRELCAIAFTPQAESRAAIEKVNDMSAFNVWGWHNDGSTTTNIFNATLVSRDAGWNYTDGVRYWQTGKTYDFYALHPATLPDGISVGVSATGTVTVTNFDCSVTGTGAIDLMTASKNGIIYQTNETPQPVELRFFHELARVKFTVKSENAMATINSFKVYGVKYKGTLSKNAQGSTWDQTTICSTDDTPFVGETFEFNTTNGWEKDMLGDMLLIPDSDLTDAHVEIAYRYQGETTDRTYVVDLNTSTTPQWEAGKSYNYTLTIKGGTLSITVNVVDWTTQETSVSW